MAQAFLGLRVSITLDTGLSLEGQVSHIDSDSQLLTLKDGKLDQSSCMQFTEEEVDLILAFP
jgi:hypothetical protein